MSQPKVLMLTFTLGWLHELRGCLEVDEIDVVVKAHRQEVGIIPEHSFYEPEDNASVPLPDAAVREIELSMRRCFIGSKQRKQVIARYLIINADRLLEKRAYKTVIFRTVPHMPHEFAVYHCAHARGIPTWFFDETGYFNRAFVFSDIYKRKPGDALAISSQSNFAFSEEQRKIVSINDLRKNYKGLRIVGTGRLRNALKVVRAYLYVLKASLTGRSVAGSAGFCKNISKNNLFDRWAFWTNLVFRISRLRRVLAKIEAKGARADNIKNHVIFLLNFQPERTTLPDAYPYYDSRQCISELRDVGSKVFIKEHPIQLNYPGDGALLRGATWRTEKFYNDLEALSEGFLPRSIQIDDTLAQNNLVATATGTVAVEMFFRKKPVLTFGNTWISSLPNTLCLAEINQRHAVDALNYDPFEELEQLFNKTIEVLNWDALTRSDKAALRFLVERASSATQDAEPHH